MAKEKNDNHWREWLERVLSQTENNRFYGKLVLSFESGKLVYLKKEETIKPPKQGVSA